MAIVLVIGKTEVLLLGPRARSSMSSCSTHGGVRPHLTSAVKRDVLVQMSVPLHVPEKDVRPEYDGTARLFFAK